MIEGDKSKIESAHEQELAEENRSFIDLGIVQAPEQRRDKSHEHDDDFKRPHRKVGEESFPQTEENQDVDKKQSAGGGEDDILIAGFNGMQQPDDGHDDGWRGSPVNVILSIVERYIPLIRCLLAELIVLIWVLQSENGRIGLGEERDLSVIESLCELSVKVRGGGPFRPRANADKKNIDHDDRKRAQGGEPINSAFPKKQDRFVFWMTGFVRINHNQEFAQ